MAGLKISQLTSGNPALPGDQLVVDRAGVNYRVDAGSIGDPTVFNAVDYGVVADARFGNDGTIVTGQPTLVSATGNFSSADNGKLVIVCNSTTGAYPFGTGLVTQLSCQSATQITLSTNSNASATGTEMWGVGTDNGATFNACATAAWTAGKTLTIPPGAFLVATPPFVTAVSSPYGFVETGDLCGAAGTTNSMFILHPNITSGITSNQPFFYKATVATGWYPTGGADAMINNIRLTTLFGALPVGSTSMVVFGAAGSSLRMRGIQVQAFNASNGGLVTIAASSSGEGYYDLMNWQNTNCVGINLIGQGCNTVSNSILAYFTANAPIICGSGAVCNLISDYVTGTPSIQCLLNAIVKVFGGAYWSNNQFNGTTGGVSLDLFGAEMETSGVNIVTTGMNVHATGCTFISSGTNNITGSGTFTDLGGNTFSSTGAHVNGPSVFGHASSTGVALTAGALVLDGNWGTTSSISAVAGANSPIQFTVQNGTAAVGASPTIAYTFPVPYLQTPLWVSAVQVGGTNAVGTFVVSSLTATGCVLTFSLTPTANDTEIVQLQIFSQ